MLLVIIEDIEKAENVLQTSALWGDRLKKEVAVIVLQADTNPIVVVEKYRRWNCQPVSVETMEKKSLDIEKICEGREVSILFVQLMQKKRRWIQFYLDRCRNLRIPYLLLHIETPFVDCRCVGVSVSFLVEDQEKAQFAAIFARFFGGEIWLLLAKDYGSKAVYNAEKIKKVLDGLSVSYKEEKAESDSFKLDNELLSRSENGATMLSLISASRAYALDDTIFGAKELRLLKKYTSPILLINPRSDLYVLCD